MSSASPTVFIVDNDPRVLRALSRLIGARGYATASFSSPEAFFEAHDPTVPGCIVLDLMMPQVSGLELQARLRDRGIERPILFLTGHGDIPTAVRALKGGASDFLTKPVTEDVLIAAIVRALQADLDQRRAAAARQSATDRVATLTPRERQVLALVVTGLLNKQIAGELGMAVKTVKVHRGRVMAKLGVRSVSELVRIAEQTGIVLAGRG